MVRGVARSKIVVLPGLNAVPWKLAGKNPEVHCFGPPKGSFPSVITTYAGRFSLAAPSPYVVHEPSDGRPAKMSPVFIWQTEPTWFNPSAQQDFTTAISST